VICYIEVHFKAGLAVNTSENIGVVMKEDTSTSRGFRYTGIYVYYTQTKHNQLANLKIKPNIPLNIDRTIIYIYFF